MKTFVIISCLFVAVVFIMSPVHAAAWNITGGTGWTVSAYPENAYKMGDGDEGTYWYNAGSGTYSELTWSPTNYYSKIRVLSAGGGNEYWSVNGDCQEIIYNTWTNLSVSPGSALTMRFYAGDATCMVDNSWGKFKEIQYENGTPPAPIANFTATPLNATAPAYIPFTDTSENEYGTCEYNWSFSPTDGVLAAPTDLDNEDITILFTENGDFTISHGVSCDGGSNISTKTDYIHIYNATALSTFCVRAVDAHSGYVVNGAEVDVFDIENSSWTNQTSATGEVTVTALTGHTINAYGSATGYDDGESLALPVVADSLYPVYMWPSSFTTNVSEGNVTLYVTVLEDGTNTRLSGIGVTLTGPSTGGADFTNGYTNDNGIYQTVIKNETDYKVTIIAQDGYLGANKVFNSGTGSGGDAYVEVTLWLQKNYITTAPTATTLPGGGTPTATLTYLPNCDPSASDYDAAKCRTSKGSSGLNLLADNLENLILLCIVVTMFYLLGIRLGR